MYQDDYSWNVSPSLLIYPVTPKQSSTSDETTRTVIFKVTFSVAKATVRVARESHAELMWQKQDISC